LNFDILEIINCVPIDLEQPRRLAQWLACWFRSGTLSVDVLLHNEGRVLDKTITPLMMIRRCPITVRVFNMPWRPSCKRQKSLRAARGYFQNVRTCVWHVKVE
jgi:hypothetical protein